MPDGTVGNSEHYDEAIIERERAAEREDGPELSVARPSDDTRDFQMPPIPAEVTAGTEPDTAEELEEARNPLGYTATEPTREEMDAGRR
jgi:hypothetical protein